MLFKEQMYCHALNILGTKVNLSLKLLEHILCLSSPDRQGALKELWESKFSLPDKTTYGIYCCITVD